MEDWWGCEKEVGGRVVTGCDQEEWRGGGGVKRRWGGGEMMEMWNRGGTGDDEE